MRFHKYKTEYALELMRLASSDFLSGNALVQTKMRIENACFFYQQSVEKCLKAVLVSKEISFPSIHDLHTLLALLPEIEPPCPNSHDIPTLNIYAAQRRYEEGPVEATEEDAEIAKDLAQAVLDWARNIVKIKEI